MTSAVATNATSTSPGNFTQTYVYDAIGNITNKSDISAYLYQGTNYANPHAATSVNGVTYAYDNNGNLTSDSTWTHAWNYDNRLTQSTGGSTVTYAYDHTGQRVKLVNGSSTIRYANKLYNSDGTKNVKHIYAGSQLIATLENATLQYIHTDHLTGSNAATDSTAGMVQLIDYFPYGSMRIDWKYGSFDEQRKFTGHMYDRDTSLTYAEARYYKQNIGRFLSQDPVFLALGSQDAIKLRKKLGNPQGLNSYTYSLNNPLKYVDVTGEEAYEFTMKLVSGAAGLASSYLQSKAEALSNSGHQTLGSVLNTIAGGLDTYSTAFDTSASPEARADAFSSMAGNLYIVTGLIQPTGKSGEFKQWKVGDPVNAPTRNGNPSWSTVRERHWMDRASESGAAKRWGAENIERMREGRAPQRYNPDKSGLESMELSHEPVPRREGGTEFVERWPQEHARVDEFRHPGY